MSQSKNYQYRPELIIGVGRGFLVFAVKITSLLLDKILKLKKLLNLISIVGELQNQTRRRMHPGLIPLLTLWITYPLQLLPRREMTHI